MPSVCCILEVCCDEPARKKAVELADQLSPTFSGNPAIVNALEAVLREYRLVPRDLDPAVQVAITAIVTAHLKSKGIPTEE